MFIVFFRRYFLSIFMFTGKDKQNMGELNGVVERKVADELAELFTGDLNPVAPKAQKKVPIPEGYVSFFGVETVMGLW